MRDLEARLAEIKRAYVSELPGRADSLGALWEQVQAAWQPHQVQELYRAAHSLAGSGATFGFDALSRSARALEIPMKSLANGEAEDVKRTRESISPLVDTLLAEIRNAAGR